MKFSLTHLKYLLITGFLFFAIQQKNYAGGFPIRPKSLLLSPSVNYFFAKKGWDTLRNTKAFANEGRFNSVTFSLYSEYGLSRRFSLVAVLPYAMNSYKDNAGYNQTSQGLTDLEVGVKYYAANINYIYYFCIQGTYITPLYNNLSLGYSSQGAELKLSFAGSGKLWSKNFYFNVENGVRQYFGGEGPIQDRYSGTFGITLDSRFKHQVTVTAGGFYATSSLGTAFNAKQIGTNKNFAFNQASLSYGYSFVKQFSVFLTAGTFLSGRNTGNGSSAAIAFIIKP